MDQALLREHLALAERHIAAGERHIARQIEIVAQFERQGYDATEARHLLDQFQQSQAMHIADRDRLLKALV